MKVSLKKNVVAKLCKTLVNLRAFSFDWISFSLTY